MGGLSATWQQRIAYRPCALGWSVALFGFSLADSLFQPQCVLDGGIAGGLGCWAIHRRSGQIYHADERLFLSPSRADYLRLFSLNRFALLDDAPFSPDKLQSSPLQCSRTDEREHHGRFG